MGRICGCVLSFASLQYVTEPNFVSNEKYSAKLILLKSSVCTLLHPGSLLSKEEFSGFVGKITYTQKDQARTMSPQTRLAGDWSYQLMSAFKQGQRGISSCSKGSFVDDPLTLLGR